MNIIPHLRRAWRTYALGALGALAAALVLTNSAPGEAALQLLASAAAVLIVMAAMRAAMAWTPRPVTTPALLRAVEPSAVPTARTRDDGFMEVRIGEVVLTLTGDEADELVAQLVAARTDQERASLGFGRGRHTACPLCACLIGPDGDTQHDRWHDHVEQLRDPS